MKTPSTKRCVGKPPRQTEDPLAPPCVASFAGDNFGVTYQGVTKDEISVLFYFDGFIKNFKKEEAKERIQGIIQRLNDGELVKPDEIRSILVPYTPQSHAA